MYHIHVRQAIALVLKAVEDCDEEVLTVNELSYMLRKILKEMKDDG